MSGLTVEDREFLAGLQVAVRDMNGDGVLILHETGGRVVQEARRRAPRLKHPDPRYRPGQLADSLDIREGRDARGPWVDVGTDDPIGIFVEFGTYKDKAQPFMRPALSLAARVTGGRTRGAGGRARLLVSRARKRSIIRVALRRRQITGGQARSLSRQVSTSFRFRARRR